MISDTLNRMVDEKTRQRLRSSLERGGRELKRAAPPWGLILLGALAVGLAASCLVHAFFVG